MEIASYSEHLLTECTTQGQYVQCPQCTEAVTHDELEQHSQGIAQCTPATEDEVHCPLCHQNLPIIDGPEETWKLHLMQQCTQNPRRLMAMQRKGKLGGAGGGSSKAATGNALGSRTQLPKIQPTTGKPTRK